MGAGNQQERLAHTEEAKHFLAGFIEGEGSLCVSIKRQPRARFGYLVDPEFFLYQHESGRPLLELARQIFDSGAIVRKSGSPTVLVYAVTARCALEQKVIPFYERYVMPLTCKRETFERFREIVEMQGRREHLAQDGLIRIVEKAYAMNPSSKGRQRLRTLHEVCERILRGHTPNIPATG